MPTDNTVSLDGHSISRKSHNELNYEDPDDNQYTLTPTSVNECEFTNVAFKPKTCSFEISQGTSPVKILTQETCAYSEY